MCKCNIKYYIIRNTNFGRYILINTGITTKLYNLIEVK